MKSHTPSSLSPPLIALVSLLSTFPGLPASASEPIPAADQLVAVLGEALGFDEADLLANDTFIGPAPFVEITQLPERGELEVSYLEGRQVFTFRAEVPRASEAPIDPGSEAIFRYRLVTSHGDPPSAEVDVRIRLTIPEIPLAGHWDAFSCYGGACPTDPLDIGIYLSATGVFRLYRTDCPYLDRDSCSVVQKVELTVPKGRYGWQPLVGDWDGDGRDGVGVRNPLNGEVELFEITFSCADEGPGPCLEPHSVGSLGLFPDWPLTGRWELLEEEALGVYDFQSGSFFMGPKEPGSKDYDHSTFLDTYDWRPIPLAGDWNGDTVDTAAIFDLETLTLYYVDGHRSHLVLDYPPPLPAGLELTPRAFALSGRRAGWEVLGVYDSVDPPACDFYLFPLSDGVPRGGGAVHVTIPKDPEDPDAGGGG